MIKRIKAKCLDCGQRFVDEIGNPGTTIIYRCQKCGFREVVPLKSQESAPEKNCEKFGCGGVMGPNVSLCPRCFSSNVKILSFL
jgi:DNA-directed RNA polymerase subunit RPC12/RpoP